MITSRQLAMWAFRDEIDPSGAMVRERKREKKEQSLNDFYAEFRKEGFAISRKGLWRFQGEACSDVMLESTQPFNIESVGILIRSIYVQREHRGKGLANQILGTLIKCADRTGLPLYVFARPFAVEDEDKDCIPDVVEDNAPDKNSLRKWYEKNDFIQYSDDGLLRRKPKC